MNLQDLFEESERATVEVGLKHDSVSNATIYVDTMYDDHATTAALEFIGPDGEVVSTTGSSKRERFDARNRTVGELYATARALQKLVYQLEARAKHLVAADIPLAEERQTRYVLGQLAFHQAKHAAIMEQTGRVFDGQRFQPKGSNAEVAAAPKVVSKNLMPLKKRGGKGGKGKKG